MLLAYNEVVSMPRTLLAMLLLCVPRGQAADDAAAIRDAVAAMQRGDFVSAEQKLRGELGAHSADARILSLLGVALDNQKRLGEADGFHRRALAIAPKSIDVLGNFGNHLAASGDEESAGQAWMKIVAIDPANVNANLQLARQALKRKSGAEALRHLTRLPADQQEASPAAVLRLGALFLAGNRVEAEGLAARLSTASEADLKLSFSVGVALANAGQYDAAESFFTRVLAAAPADFNVLYNLGVVASLAGHHQRARDLLEAAIRQQPKNPEVLFRLAGVDFALKQAETAIGLLAQAAKLAPERADIQKLLAITTTNIGALADAIAAWDRYLKLQPNDDTARRERGYAAVQVGQLAAGIADLEWFLSRHPDDATGQYELGMAKLQTDPAQGLPHLEKALAVKPDFAAARAARGNLYYQQGKPEAAVADLESAAKLQPDDAINLDRLGQTYLALDRAADSVRVLRRAAELAPEDSKIQLHYARALADAGETAEAKVAMDRFRQLGPATKSGVPAGLVEYLALTPDERRADYRARVEKAIREHADDGAAQLEYLKLSIEDGKPEQIQGAVRKIVEMKSGAPVLIGAGRALLAARQYALAKELLEQAAGSGVSGDVEVDVAIARARILDAAGKADEAIAALHESLEAAPRRPDLYWHAAALLVKNHRASDAVRVLDAAARALPEDLEILLMKATALELAGQNQDALRLLDDIQNRRPEWAPVWVARGLMLAAHQRAVEARRAFETAVALGARTPDASDLARLFQSKPPSQW
jgi:tetratricopeptide (TPR) repeat protein